MDEILKELQELKLNNKELIIKLKEVKAEVKSNKKEIKSLKEGTYNTLTKLELQEMRINEIQDNLISHRHNFNFESAGSHKVDMYNL